MRLLLEGRSWGFKDVYQNTSDDSARGVYINYLQMRGFILLPVFDLLEDDLALRTFDDLFPGTTIATVESNDFADDGGVVNYVTWNIEYWNKESVRFRDARRSSSSKVKQVLVF